MPYRKINTSLFLDKSYIEVDGVLMTGEYTDEMTAPVKDSFDIATIKYKGVDIHDLLINLGYDTSKIEELVLNKFKDQ